jgi:hypothetical protein
MLSVVYFAGLLCPGKCGISSLAWILGGDMLAVMDTHGQLCIFKDGLSLEKMQIIDLVSTSRACSAICQAFIFCIGQEVLLRTLSSLGPASSNFYYFPELLFAPLQEDN